MIKSGRESSTTARKGSVMFRRLAPIIFALPLVPVPLPAAEPAADFYVAPNGNDRWSGTLAAPNDAGSDGPFATLEKARDALRSDNKSGGAVFIRGGAYALTHTFSLGPQDSGTTDRHTVFAAYPGEQPVLSGGYDVKGNWARADRAFGWAENVVFIDLPAKTIVDDLFVDGKRQPPARMPDSGFFRAGNFKNSNRIFTYREDRLKAWPDAANGMVVIKPYEWVDFRLPIAQIDEKARTVTLVKSAGYPLAPPNSYSEYAVENVQAALDTPGEWCFDPKLKRIYFMPPAGTDMNTAQIVCAGLHMLVTLDGDTRRDRWVEYVDLIGLTFKHTGREGRWRHYEGTAVRFAQGVRNSSVQQCRFLDLGGCGVVIWKECSDNSVLQSEFTRTGDTCVKIFDYLGEGPPMSSGNRILNNYFHHCGTVRKSISAIGIEGSEKNLAANNLIHDMPYNGIHLSGTRFTYWNRKNEPSLEPPYTAAKIKPYIRSRLNVVANNHIHHVMQELYDGGAIYFWGTMGEGSNVIRNNLIHHVGTGKRTAVGIYLDDNCDDVHVRGNVVYGANMGMHLHGAPRNLIENNIFAYCGAADISIQPEDYNMAPMETVFTRNIVAWGSDKLFSTGEGWNRNWDRKPIGTMDHNLYWRDGQPVSPGTGHLAGFDKHSVIADPGIISTGAGKLVLQPGAAAGKLGISPIDLSQTGLIDPPAWLPDLPKPAISLPLTPDKLSVLPGRKPRRPVAIAYRTSAAVEIDGKPGRSEWPGWTKTTCMTISELHDKSGRTDMPAFAYAMYDDRYLYVALSNNVKDASSLRSKGGTWGKDEGAELCLRCGNGSICVLRGYPSGAFESSTEAGASADTAETLGKATTYAAAIGDRTWTAEYRVAMDAAGIDPANMAGTEFNIGILKKDTSEWIAWTGTGDSNWRVDKAGTFQWEPVIEATAPDLISNGDMETADTTARHWNPLWWNTSKEDDTADRDPKCNWITGGVMGSKCLEMVSTDRNRMATRQGGFLQEIESPGPGVYLLTYDLRAENLSLTGASEGGSFTAYVHIVDKKGKHGANLGQSESIVRQGTFDWARFAVPVEVPADARTLTVIFQFQRVTGRVLVDNVSFRRSM